MDILGTLYDEVVGFLGISQALELLQAGDYSVFTTYDGVVSLIYPIIPLLLVLEFILGLVYKKPNTKVYKVNFLIYVFNRFIGRFIAIAMVTLIIGWLQPYALFQTKMTWYWFIYGCRGNDSIHGNQSQYRLRQSCHNYYIHRHGHRY